ncbi:hypothetical protein N185_16990 [Sinorhizobium sp. GW3]|nr:hypothetical protein N185_16990 [Sinorhizobium sp. GW3]
MEPVLESSEGAPILLRVAEIRSAYLEISELIVATNGRETITVEPRSGVTFLNELSERVRKLPDINDSDAIRCILVEAGYEMAARVLDTIELDLTKFDAEVRSISNSLGTSRTFGVSDLYEIEGQLNGVDAVLSHASQSLCHLTQLARIIRRDVRCTLDHDHQRLVDLVADGEAGLRRVEFIIDRRRFHNRAVTQVIATSDLDIVKIFTVLWTVFLPGTALINWYGQNFQVMPELSWYWSSWIQLAGVLVVTLVPILAVKRSGQLR